MAARFRLAGGEISSAIPRHSANGFFPTITIDLQRRFLVFSWPSRPPVIPLVAPGVNQPSRVEPSVSRAVISAMRSRFQGTTVFQL